MKIQSSVIIYQGLSIIVQFMGGGRSLRVASTKVFFKLIFAVGISPLNAYYATFDVIT